MSSQMKYMVRTPDGNEYGPVDQDGLLQWAQTGRLTAECEVRNALMNKWNPATKVPFLKDVVAKQTPTVSAESSVKGALSKLRGGTAGKGTAFRYTPAPLGLRFASWLIDTVILVVVGGVLIIGANTMLGNGADPKVVYTGFTLALVFCSVMYYTILLAFTAQSVGQKFWGIMVVRPNGDPVLMARALVFSVFYLLLFWSSFPFIFSLPNKKALQDIFSGLVVARISKS